MTLSKVGWAPWKHTIKIPRFPSPRMVDTYVRLFKNLGYQDIKSLEGNPDDTKLDIEYYYSSTHV